MRPYSKDPVSSPVIKKRNVSGKGPKGQRPKEAGGQGGRVPVARRKKSIWEGGTHSYLGLVYAPAAPKMQCNLACIRAACATTSAWPTRS